MPIATTLKLPESLKARVQALAGETGQTPHAFMLQAIEAQATAAELRRDFVASALRAEQEVAEYGKVYSLDEMSRYLKAKVAGTKPRAPRTRKAG
jgi:predicted transcriptional regulator